MARAPRFTVLPTEEYVAALQKVIPRAKHRIVLAAMLIRSDTIAGDILRQIVAAAKRGVKVLVVSDVFAQSDMSRPPSGQVTLRNFKVQCAETQHIFKDINRAGGNAVWIGKMQFNPFRGRYHVKATIIDDNVFSFGGVNFSDSEFTPIDYMLHTKDASLADDLQKLIKENVRALPAKDKEMLIGTDSSVLFDAGVPGKSIIYERACQLAEQAVKVTYVSQMAPSGKLAALLRRAHVTYYANRPTQSGFHPNALAQLWDQQRNGLSNHYEGKQYIHAKFILYELKNGDKALISGSHNFSWRGVSYGTKEIALCSTDAGLWRRLHDIVYKVASAG